MEPLYPLRGKQQTCLCHFKGISISKIPASGSPISSSKRVSRLYHILKVLDGSGPFLLAPIFFYSLYILFDPRLSTCISLQCSPASALWPALHWQPLQYSRARRLVLRTSSTGARMAAEQLRTIILPVSGSASICLRSGSVVECESLIEPF